MSPALVLVHGGQHDARCWQPTTQELNRNAPEVEVLAIDLPGRGTRPDGLLGYSVETCVDAALEQIDAAGLSDVVLVGHSAAGLTMPALAERLGAERVRRMIFVSCCVPPEGGSINDALRGPLRPVARAMALRRRPVPPARRIGSRFFCNGMTPAQRTFSISTMCAETPKLGAIRVTRAGLPSGIPMTWVLLLRDRALSPDQQRRSIERLGGIEDVVELATCHNAMISEPAALARILLDRVP